MESSQHLLVFQHNLLVNTQKNACIVDLLGRLRSLRTNASRGHGVLTSTSPVIDRDPRQSSSMISFMAKAESDLCRNTKCVFVHDFLKVFAPKVDVFRLPIHSNNRCIVCETDVKLSAITLTNKNTIKI